MKTQNLHSEGETDYLEILKRNFEEFVKKIKKDTTLSKEEKEEKIDNAEKEYKHNKKQIFKKLF